MSFLYLIYIDSGTFLGKKNCRRLLSNFYGAVNFLAMVVHFALMRSCLCAQKLNDYLCTFEKNAT